jgi:hypothetical protein
MIQEELLDSPFVSVIGKLEIDGSAADVEKAEAAPEIGSMGRREPEDLELQDAQYIAIFPVLYVLGNIP